MPAIIGGFPRDWIADFAQIALFVQSMSGIDAINHRILRELEANGRISNLELAERVGLSPSACLRRVQDLERRGIISGYRAVIDRSKLGVGLTVIVAVRLSVQTRDVPTIQATVLIVAAAYSVGSLLADIGSIILNPKLRT